MVSDQTIFCFVCFLDLGILLQPHRKCQTMTLMWYVKEMYRVNSVSPGRGRKGVCRGVWG